LNDNAVASGSVRAVLTGLPQRLVLDGLVEESAMLDAIAGSRERKTHLVSWLVSHDMASARDIAIAAATEFGMPLLEAMIHGCPVISSNCTSLPEAGGDSALYCPPDSADAWRDAMFRLASEPELRGDLRRRGTTRAQTCTWDAAGQAYVRLYDGLGGNSAMM